MWVLDSSAGLRKISPIQIAIMLEFAKKSPEPMHITELIASLKATFPAESWEPKKGTIYPSVHNLDARGYLRLHHPFPKGYSITAKGKEAIDKMISQFNKQMDLYMIYYTYILNNYADIEPEKANKIKANVLKSLEEFIENYQL
ncbi:MAG: PadR family transcriptional regulator [Asgard group archaeon]|nr:PadR family transcriptional regulator [Asgard group archaeon]